MSRTPARTAAPGCQGRGAASGPAAGGRARRPHEFSPASPLFEWASRARVEALTLPIAGRSAGAYRTSRCLAPRATRLGRQVCAPQCLGQINPSPAKLARLWRTRDRALCLLSPTPVALPWSQTAAPLSVSQNILPSKPPLLSFGGTPPIAPGTYALHKDNPVVCSEFGQPGCRIRENSNDRRSDRPQHRRHHPPPRES